MKRAVFVRRALAVSAAVCLAATWAFAGDTVVEDIVVRINNQIITRSELERNRAQLLKEAQQQGLSATDATVQEKEKDLLRDAIDTQLLVLKAKDLGISVENDLVKQLDDMRKQLDLDIMEALETEAQKQGVSFEDFKEQRPNQLYTQRVLEQEVYPQIQVTTEEKKKYYEENKPQMELPEQVRLSEILITPAAAQNAEPTPEALAAAEKKAQQALADIKGGKKFEAVAKEMSADTSAANGGDLGYFKRGTLSKELEDKVFAMKRDEMTDVVRTRQGFVILKVTEHNQAGIPSFEQMEPQITQAMMSDKFVPKMRAYLTTLREEAYIYIKPGYVDSGASPNQTRPVEVASGAASAKSKAIAAKEKEKKKHFVLF
jgi:peptidyl-prolyl cis-trans isomerase SurA